jgi:hypothetical protein
MIGLAVAAIAILLVATGVLATFERPGADPSGPATSAQAGPAPSRLSISASVVVTPSTTDVGLSVTVRTTITGASGNFTMAYSGLPPGCPSVDSVLFTCTPEEAGSYVIALDLSNTTGATGSSSASLQVNARPQVTSFGADPATITIGQSTTVRTATSGGTAPVSVLEYSGLPVGCASSSSAVVACTPSVPGTFSLSVLVADQFGVAAGGNATLTVNPSSSGSGGGIRITSFGAFPNPMELGSSTTLSVTSSGGNGSLYYSYSGLPPGCTSSDVASLACGPAEAGNFTVTVAVQDRLGDSNWAELALEVVAPLPSQSQPGGPTVLGFWASPGVISLGQSTVLQVLVSGGSAPYSYYYEGLPDGCGSTSVSSLTCTPSAAGEWSIQVVVTDALGTHASATVYLLVNSPTTGEAVASPSAPLDLSWLGSFGPGVAVGAVAVLVAVLVSRGRAPPIRSPPREPAPRPSEPKSSNGTAAPAAAPRPPERTLP